LAAAREGRELEPAAEPAEAQRPRPVRVGTGGTAPGAARPQAAPPPPAPQRAASAKTDAKAAPGRERPVLKQELLRRMQLVRPLFAATIELCQVAGPDEGGGVTLRLATDKKLHLDRLGSDALQKELAQMLSEIAGRPSRSGSSSPRSRPPQAPAAPSGPAGRRRGRPCAACSRCSTGRSSKTTNVRPPDGILAALSTRRQEARWQPDSATWAACSSRPQRMQKRMGGPRQGPRRADPRGHRRRGRGSRSSSTACSESRRSRFQKSAVDPDDVESLEDLVTAAIRQALGAAKDLHKKEMAKVTGGLNLPAWASEAREVPWPR
jgi:hypothetical protein